MTLSSNSRAIKCTCTDELCKYLWAGDYWYSGTLTAHIHWLVILQRRRFVARLCVWNRWAVPCHFPTRHNKQSRPFTHSLTHVLYVISNTQRHPQDENCTLITYEIPCALIFSIIGIIGIRPWNHVILSRCPLEHATTCPSGLMSKVWSSRIRIMSTTCRHYFNVQSNQVCAVQDAVCAVQDRELCSPKITKSKTLVWNYMESLH